MTERTVSDNAAAGRFEIRVGDAVAGYLEYRREGSALAFVHTVVEPAYEGQGIGSALARAALDAVRDRGAQALPQCPFVRSWIARHPDYLELVPPGERARFDLSA